jgi:hypothetical protein
MTQIGADYFLQIRRLPGETVFTPQVSNGSMVFLGKSLICGICEICG